MNWIWDVRFEGDKNADMVMGRNFLENSSCHNQTKLNEGGEIQLRGELSVSGLVGIIGIIGNGLVIYFSKKGDWAGAFRYLNKIVRNLAITDFLFNVLAVPCTMVYWHLGEYLKK